MMRFTRSGSLKLVITAIMLLWASIVVTPAKAASVTFGFEGIVDMIEPTSATFHNEGNAFDQAHTIYLSGTYTFDPGSSLGADPVSQYSNIISHFEFSLHRDAVPSVDPLAPPVVPGVNYSYTSAIPPAFGSSIIVGNDVTGIADLALFDAISGNLDGYRVVIPLGVGLNNPSFDFNYRHNNGPDPSGPFGDSSLGATSSLLTPPGLNWLQEAHANGVFRIGLTTGEVVNGTMLSMHLVATPLPPAVILFGAGIVSLIGLGARNWRQRRDGQVAGSKD